MSYSECAECGREFITNELSNCEICDSLFCDECKPDDICTECDDIISPSEVNLDSEETIITLACEEESYRNIRLKTNNEDDKDDDESGDDNEKSLPEGDYLEVESNE